MFQIYYCVQKRCAFYKIVLVKNIISIFSNGPKIKSSTSWVRAPSIFWGLLFFFTSTPAVASKSHLLFFSLKVGIHLLEGRGSLETLQISKWRKRFVSLPKMRALEGLLECVFSIPLSEYKMGVYLEGLLERCSPYKRTRTCGYTYILVHRLYGNSKFPTTRNYCAVKHA